MSPRLVQWLRRHDSLFVRLVLLQGGLAIGLSAVYFGFYFVDRNQAIATLMADQWADALRQASGQPVLHGHAAVDVRASLPPGASVVPHLAPRIDAFKRELARRGVPVQQMAWDNTHQPTRVWALVDGPDHQAMWLGFDGPLMADHELVRLIIGLIAVSLLAWLMAWWPSRRLTRRLVRLRQHMRDGLPFSPAEFDLGAAPEVVDIERAYAQLLRQIEQQHSERSLLLAGVSHDLRSPLSRIRMAAELLPDDPQIQARRTSIVSNVQAADRLIESFMDFVRSTELPLDQSVDLTELACKVVAMFDRPDHELHVDAPPSAMLHQAHAHLLERALYNLVDNAFKHGAAPVHLRVLEQEQAFTLEVEDAGPGVPQAEHTWVQQAFSRGDASRTKAGSGLGLAIVRQLVERLGGRIDLEGRPGAWVVRLHLPRRSA